MNVWFVVIATGLASYLLRLSMISAPDRFRLPTRFEESAALVAPSAYAALAVTALSGAVLDAGMPGAVAPLGAAAVGALAAIRTGSHYAAILAGMPALWLLSALSTS